MLRFLIDSTRNKEGEEENEEEAGRRGDGKEDASYAREEEVDESIESFGSHRSLFSLLLALRLLSSALSFSLSQDLGAIRTHLDVHVRRDGGLGLHDMSEREGKEERERRNSSGDEKSG